MDFANLRDGGIDLIHAIKRSTFPEIADKDFKDRTIWFEGYLTTLLQRDVRQLADLEKISLLPTLIRVLCVRAGGLINDSDISREVGLNSVTGKFYRNILKMMFLTFDIPPWHRNLGKRLVKASKGYISDTSLLCHFLDLNIDVIHLNRPDLFGNIVEIYSASELKKLLSFSNIRAQLFHFRTSDRKEEVDFVLEKPAGRIFGIEIKKAEIVNSNDFKGLKALATLTKKEFIGGIVLYSGKNVGPFGKNLWAVPFHILWQ